MKSLECKTVKSPYHAIEVYDSVNAPSISKRYYDVTYLRELLSYVGAPRTLNAVELFGGHDYYSNKLRLALPFDIQSYKILERNDNQPPSDAKGLPCAQGDARTCDYPANTNLVLSWYFSMNAIQTLEGLIAFFTNAARQAPESGSLYMYNNIYPFTCYTPAGDYYDGGDCFKVVTRDNVIYDKLVALAGTDKGHFYATYSLRTERHIINNSFGLHYDNLVFHHELHEDPTTLMGFNVTNPILVRPWTTGEIAYALSVASDVTGTKHKLSFFADYNKSPYKENSVCRTPVRANPIMNNREDVTQTIAKRSQLPFEDIQHPTDMMVVFSR